MSDTMGFILYHVIYGSVWVLPMVGYGVHGMGAVWENLTHGLPVLNPSSSADFLLLSPHCSCISTDLLLGMLP